jgi:hypothetical protein
MIEVEFTKSYIFRNIIFLLNGCNEGHTNPTSAYFPTSAADRPVSAPYAVPGEIGLLASSSSNWTTHILLEGSCYWLSIDMFNFFI